MSLHQHDNFMTWMTSLDGVDEQAALEGEEVLIEQDAWRGRSRTTSLRNGIEIQTLRSEILEDFVLSIPYERTPRRFSSFYVERGDLDLQFYGTPKTKYSPSLGIMYSPQEGPFEGSYSRGKRINVVDCKAPIDLLEDTLEEIPTPEVQALLNEQHERGGYLHFPINREMRSLIKNILSSELNGALRQLQLEGIAIQLFALQLHLAQHSSATHFSNRLTFTSAAQKQIEEAYVHLLSDIKSPPSIKELAENAGMSERRLNAGLTQLFGGSAFELLRRERMETARQALREGPVPLKQIAYRVGYNHTSNFINAFTRYFGVSPRQFQKRT